MAKEKASQEEIYRTMRQDIEGGEFPASSRLPSVRTHWPSALTPAPTPSQGGKPPHGIRPVLGPPWRWPFCALACPAGS